MIAPDKPIGGSFDMAPPYDRLHTLPGKMSPGNEPQQMSQ